MNDKLAQLQARFSSHKISFGYIGNCGPGFDDRAFKVFTDIHSVGVFGDRRTVSIDVAGPDYDVAQVAVAIRAHMRTERQFNVLAKMMQFSRMESRALRSKA